MRVLITGRQGSGKTTQAKILSSKHNFFLVETGGSVRKYAQEDSERGRLLKSALDNGILAENTVVSQIIKDAVEGSSSKDIVVDGYPRDVKQLEFYDPQYEKVIYLDLSPEESYNRLLKRGREDDKPELIKERLGIFERETMKSINHYRDMGILITIDASPSIEEVTSSIEQALGL